MASEIPLLHFEPDPEQADVHGIKCDLVLEWAGVFYHCQITTGTYTSSGRAGQPFDLEILYHKPVGDHRTPQYYSSYEEARDMQPAEEASE